MGHHTDQHEVSATSPRRSGKPVANANEYKKRLVPLQHNAGCPIQTPKLNEEGKKKLRALKKQWRKEAMTFHRSGAILLPAPSSPLQAPRSKLPAPSSPLPAETPTETKHEPPTFET